MSHEQDCEFTVKREQTTDYRDGEGDATPADGSAAPAGNDISVATERVAISFIEATPRRDGSAMSSWCLSSDAPGESGRDAESSNEHAEHMLQQ